MKLEYAKDNLTQQPYRHYLKRYQETSPKVISESSSLILSRKGAGIPDSVYGSSLSGDASGISDPSSGTGKRHLYAGRKYRRTDSAAPVSAGRERSDELRENDFLP